LASLLPDLEIVRIDEPGQLRDTLLRSHVDLACLGDRIADQGDLRRGGEYAVADIGLTRAAAQAKKL